MAVCSVNHAVKYDCLGGWCEMWSRSQGRTVCRALCVLRASERATGNRASHAQDYLVPEEACRLLWLARQRQKALNNTEYCPLGIIHSASIKPPPGSCMSSHLSMKQISRQRLSPDLQNMKSSSRGGGGRLPPTPGRRDGGVPSLC